MFQEEGEQGTLQSIHRLSVFDRLPDEPDLCKLYGDIAHMPKALMRKVLEDERLWKRYCRIFDDISKILKNGELPSREKIDKALGKFALQYLLDTLERIYYPLRDMGLPPPVKGLDDLPRCTNDFRYDKIRAKLAINRRYRAITTDHVFCSDLGSSPTGKDVSMKTSQGL